MKREPPPRLPETRPGPAPGSRHSGQRIPSGTHRGGGRASAQSHRPGLQPGGLDPDPTTPRPPGPLASPRPRGRPPPRPPQPTPAAGGVQVTRGRVAGGWMWYACAHREFPFAAAKRRSHPNRPIMGRLCCPVVQTRELPEFSRAGARLFPSMPTAPPQGWSPCVSLTSSGVKGLRCPLDARSGADWAVLRRRLGPL